MQQKYLKNTGQTSLNIETCEPLERTTSPTLISLPVASPAKTLARRANEQESVANALALRLPGQRKAYRVSFEQALRVIEKLETHHG